MGDFDANGNPDVMGSRVMTDDQKELADKLRLAFNAVNTMLQGNPVSTAEAMRLYAISRTHLEVACMTAVKAVSRDHP